ncbi:hypothetical protein LTR37_015195 [Vermiconidia calcicola]|uniref:Uncharacterized protein n=1 Tax=Vermiconidia calcicola TaxID=1690605 RepID=A0ACC3MRE3_9PEZI|nr:hypothetical protein LTR37_015195 [Vermiconidia calcicola]
MPPITLWFLQASRCIRTAWLLEELGQDYEVKFSDRENGVAPAGFKKDAGGLGKFPTLKDGDTFLYESGNIAEYLCDKYDKENKLLPPLGDPKRYEVLQWVHAAEATWALHGISILYVRWNQKDGDPKKTEEGMSKNVINDMNYLEETLKKSGSKFLFGDKPNVADTMMHFTAVFILDRELGGISTKDYPEIVRYITDCEATGTYKKAVEKTGHKL